MPPIKPATKNLEQQIRNENMAIFGLLGGLVGVAGGPLGIAVGASLGAKIGDSLKVPKV